MKRQIDRQKDSSALKQKDNHSFRRATEIKNTNKVE